MGRFDALTQLEEKQSQKQENPAVPPLPLPTPPQAIQETQDNARPASSRGDNSPTSASVQPERKQRAPGKTPAPQPPGKSVNATQHKLDKFDKYSTYLRPGYRKELKLLAAELDRKDYELIDEALTLYFANHKMAALLKYWTEEALREIERIEEGDWFFFCSVNPATTHPDEMYLTPVWEQAFSSAKTPLLVLK
jgi:hypothetical protein